MDIKEKSGRFTWRIENFSSIEDEFLNSEEFIVDGIKWQIRIFPKVSWGNYLAVHLVVVDHETSGSRFAPAGLAVINQNNRKGSYTEVEYKYFSVSTRVPDTMAVLNLDVFHDPEGGYLINDECVVEAYVSGNTGLFSHELMLESVKDSHKLRAYGSVKAKPVEFTTSSQSVDIESEEPTEEDMKTFFTSLEAELSSCKIVFSHEDAKGALSKLDEALNMTPTNLCNSGKFSQLKQAFKILARFDDSSTTITIEEQNELLAMEERMKELADRAAKAVHDKNRLTAMESTKLMINLYHNLVRYKEVVSEVEQVEQKLASLLAEQKEIFKSSKEMKMEMEALGNEWPDYEAKAKVVEEEEKIVNAEWGRMKDFISSMKGKF